MDGSYELGIVGLGVMGRGLLLNAAESGHSVVGFDRDPGKTASFERPSGSGPVRRAESLADLVHLLRRPRAVMLLVPAGSPVDAVIDELGPQLEEGDIVIDAGNSHFRDTDRRATALTRSGILYVGTGVSGGEEGARHGASIMPGGPRAAYERVRAILEDVAAEVDGERCVTYLGPGSAGHYVKMVHNGIEYGLMQLIAETYDLMKSGFGLSNQELHETYAAWNGGELGGFLMEITSRIFLQSDDKGGGALIDQILDAARQKGTGKWTSEEAMELGVPVPTIDAAVAMRNLSALRDLREDASHVLGGPTRGHSGDRAVFLERLGRALYGAMALTYEQGLSLLARAAQVREYALRLEDVARIWQGGCIIRAALLRGIRDAYGRRPDLPSLLVDPEWGKTLAKREADLRAVIQVAVALGRPAPGLSASLAYYDAMRSQWLPANLVQAQRDVFGAHTYERIDEPGSFHTDWSNT